MLQKVLSSPTGNYAAIQQRLELSRQHVLFTPYRIEIKPYDGPCNLKCTWCYANLVNEDQHYLPSLGPPDFRRALQNVVDTKINDTAVDLYEFSGTNGDPYQSPNTLLGLEYLLANQKDTMITTNGLNLLQDGYLRFYPHLKALVVSLDAGNSADFKAVKGLDGFDRTIRGLEIVLNELQRTGAKTTTNVSAILTEQNYESMFAFVAVLDKLGVDNFIFKNNYFADLDTPFVHSLLDKGKELEARFEAQHIKIINKVLTRNMRDSLRFKTCLIRRFWATMASDGQLYACNMFIGHTGPFGNLVNTPFADIIEKTFNTSNDQLRSECQDHCSYLSMYLNVKQNEILTEAEVQGW